MEHITIFAREGRVVARCELCEGQLSTDETSLALLVEAMTDHVRVNHVDDIRVRT